MAGPEMALPFLLISFGNHHSPAYPAIAEKWVKLSNKQSFLITAYFNP
jgi:hypothetical protein